MKTLDQEQAFETVPQANPTAQPLTIAHSGVIEEDKIS